MKENSFEQQNDLRSLRIIAHGKLQASIASGEANLKNAQEHLQKINAEIDDLENALQTTSDMRKRTDDPALIHTFMEKEEQLVAELEKWEKIRTSDKNVVDGYRRDLDFAKQKQREFLLNEPDSGSPQ